MKSYTPSRAFQRAVGSEIEKINRLRAKLIKQEASLAKELAAIGKQIADHQARLRLLDFIIEGEQTHGADFKVLEGRQLRIAVIKLVSQKRVATKKYPLPIEEWYRLATDGGLAVISGTALLKEMLKSPVFSESDQAKLYYIDGRSVTRLRRQLREATAVLHEYLSRKDIDRTTSRAKSDLKEVQNEVRTLTTQLEEATESLGDRVKTTILEHKTRQRQPLNKCPKQEAPIPVYPVDSQEKAIRAAIDAATEAYQVSPEKLYELTRKVDIANARQLVWYILRQSLGLSLLDLGRLVFNRSHSTVIHAIKVVQKSKTEHPEAYEWVDELISKIKNDMKIVP